MEDVHDDLELSVNAVKVLERRYLLKDDRDAVVESPSEMFRRAAGGAAKADLRYGGKKAASRAGEEFYRMMRNLDFLPNSPALMNLGTAVGQASACFVLPVEDSIESIFNAVKYMALIHQSGGGTGFSFSMLRPKGDAVRSTRGVASGPVSFMRVFDAATDVIKQGGRRRGANMGVLRYDHPDIIEFITAKTRDDILQNFNLSVSASDRFMRAVKRGSDYELINPRTCEPTGKVSAPDVFNMISLSAWRGGDPGMLFIDEVNRHNPTPSLGDIESTNPCSEQPLLPYESCDLGSVNLSGMVDRSGEIDWEKLREAVRTGVHFLDNIIDVNHYSLSEVRDATLANRKIGLGVMGFAEMLIMMDMPYDSKEGLRTAEEVMGFINREAHMMSAELASERGVFPNFEDSVLPEWGYDSLRNAAVTTIAPTGAISIIANTSSGIEPLFAISFVRNVMDGMELLEVNRLFVDYARKNGFYSKELMRRIARSGSLKGVEKIPERVRRLFVTALDISPEWHVRMQAALQKHTDNAVSKTVNLPANASVEDVSNVFLLAHRLKCKGVTVYRYGSKHEQVLYLGGSAADNSDNSISRDHVSAESEYAGGCPLRGHCEF